MDNFPELAKLRDIHLPQPISWWPLASGWYFLFFFIVAALLGLFFFLYQKRRKKRKMVQALELLEGARKTYELNSNAQEAAIAMNEILKRFALSYFQREKVASLRGESWFEFLNQTSKINFEPYRKAIVDLPYQRPNTEKHIDLTPLFEKAQEWIRQIEAKTENRRKGAKDV